jgi:hypothetical protein
VRGEAGAIGGDGLACDEMIAVECHGVLERENVLEREKGEGIREKMLGAAGAGEFEISFLKGFFLGAP